MLRLEDLQRGSSLKGLTRDGAATVVDVTWCGSSCIELTFKDATGAAKNERVYRDDDIESRDRDTGSPRLIEAKGRAADADTVAVTGNEMAVAVNEPEKFSPAIMQVNASSADVHYVRRPFDRERQFGESATMFRISDLLSSGPAEINTL